MTHPWHMLAEGSDLDKLIQFLPWLAILVIGFIIKMVTSAARQKQAQEQKKRWDEIDGERAEAQRQQPQRQASQPQTGSSPQPQRTPHPSPAEQVIQTLRQAMGIPDQPPGASGPQPAVLQPAGAPAAAQVQRRRRPSRGRTQGEPELQVARLSEPGPARIAEEAPGPGPTPPAGIGLDLTDAERARQAIIYHEVFSAPKALRKGTEMWDT